MVAVRGITALELGLVIKELRQKVVGSYLKKFYDLGNDSFRISFHGSDGNFVLYCKPLSTLNETDFVEEAGAATNFAIAVRKRIDDSKVTDFYQHSWDRIVVIEVQARNGKHRIVIEMFGKGNVILIDENDVIEVCYMTVSYRDRDVRPRAKYLFPKSESADVEGLDSVGVAAMLEVISKSEGRMIAELSKRLNIGPIYLEEIITSAGLNPKEVLGPGEIERLGGAIMSFIGKLRSPTPTIYVRNGEVVDYSVLHLKKYDGLVHEECSCISEMLDRVNIGMRTATHDSSVTSDTVELDAVIEKQKALVKEFADNSARYAETGRLIFAHMGEINALVSSIKERKRPELDDLKAEFPDMDIVELSLKDRMIVIEVQ